MQPSSRTLPSLVVALLAGALRAFQMYAPRVFTGQGMDVSQLSMLLPLVGVVSLLVSPFGAVIAGYHWGSRTDVRTEWLRFTGAVIVAAVAGFVAMSALILAVLLGRGSAGFGALAFQAAYSLVSGIGLVSVGFIVLAGGAIAQFQGADG